MLLDGGKKARQSAREACGLALGLRAKGNAIEGTYRGARVSIDQRRMEFTDVFVFFRAPLRLGLTIRTFPPLGLVLGKLPGTRMGNFETPLGERFGVKSSFDASAITRDRSVARELHHAETFHSQVLVTDQSVRFRFDGDRLERFPVEQSLQHALALTSVIAEARLRVPVEPYEAEFVEALRALSAQIDHPILDERALTMTGQLDACETRIAVDYTERGFETVFAARYRRPLSATLELGPKHFGADFLKLFGYQDVVIGHEPFDTKMLIRGAPEGEVRALLAPPIPNALLDIDRGSTFFKLTETEITARVKSVVRDAATLGRSLNKIATVAATLSDRSRPGGSEYR